VTPDGVLETLKKIRELADGRRHYRDAAGGDGCFDALGEVRDLCDKVIEAAKDKAIVELDHDEIDLLVDSLDSHVYWQLTEPSERNSGNSLASNDPPEDPDAEPEGVRENRLKRIAAGELEEKLRGALDCNHNEGKASS